jgi:cyanophycinase
MRERSLNNTGKKLLLCLSISILMMGGEAFAQSSQAASIGPEKGWLILHGGGNKREYEHYHRFAELAGGANASVVVILTPVDLDVLTPAFLTEYKQWWKSELGLTDVSFMDTRNRQEAETEAFVAPLRKATGVWIMGGHLSNLLDSYLGTRTEREIKAVAERGGVIAGSSAGAMIQGSFLVNLTKTPSDTRLSRSGMFLDPARMVGFGLLRGVTVYPHFFARHAEKDLLEVVARYPEILGVGIDEGAAIVVHNDQFEVIGDGRVGIFESNNRAGKKYLTLSKGQKFDLRRRVVIE